MSILVTFAIEQEFAEWRRRRTFRRVTESPAPIYQQRFGGADVRVCLTGIGWENARRAAEIALADLPEICISSGFAGGLEADYRPGQILVARTVGRDDGGRILDGHERLLELAFECGAKIVERFRTVGQVVTSRAEKQRLGASADAVDMESFPLLAAAAERRLPAVAVRAICDPVEMDLPCDFSRVLDERGRVRGRALAAELALRPQRLPSLFRLARYSRKASEQLALFLDRFVERLAAARTEPPDEESLAEMTAT